MTNSPMKHVFRVLILSTFLTVAGCAGDEAPQEETSMADEEAVDQIAHGQQLYEAFCASCHGPEGKGNGPVSDALTTRPADLTRLAVDNGGAFPTDSVYAYIDGREFVQAHGTREMPVWGNIWSEVAGEPVRPEEVEQRINELVEYLRTLQDTTVVS